MAKLKFGLGKVADNSPLWMQNATAICAILIAAKHYLVDGFPGISPEVKELANGWFDYVLNTAQVSFAILVLFTAKGKERPGSDNPLK